MGGLLRRNHQGETAHGSPDGLKVVSGHPALPHQRIEDRDLVWVDGHYDERMRLAIAISRRR